MNCDCRTLESKQKQHQRVSCLSNLISKATFEEIVLLGEMNCEIDKGTSAQ